MRVLDRVPQISGLAPEVWLLTVGVKQFRAAPPARPGS